MDFEERLKAYREAERQQSGIQWIKGDLLLDLDDESLLEFSQHVDDSYQQLSNYRWVSRRYPVSVRTETLKWTHHERVASREDRLDWLKAAAERGWSVRQMLAEIEQQRRQHEDEALKVTRAMSNMATESTPLINSAFKARIDAFETRVTDDFPSQPTLETQAVADVEKTPFDWKIIEASAPRAGAPIAYAPPVIGDPSSELPVLSVEDVIEPEDEDVLRFRDAVMALSEIPVRGRNALRQLAEQAARLPDGPIGEDHILKAFDLMLRVRQASIGRG
jgi:hypothetical protein